MVYKYFCVYLLLSVYWLAEGAAKNGKNGCVLPPYPAHGTYTIHDRPEAAPGHTYDMAILTVTCDPGYVVIGNNVTYCFSKNYWQQPMPLCTRFCRLNPDPSVKYSCKVTGDGILSGTRVCHEFEPHGTVVVPECNRPVYYASSDLLNMHCFEGTWDHVAVCQPDCGTSIAKGQGLIWNGTRIDHAELPWHAGIYDKLYTPYMQVCGGSLVSTTVVISAAHCFWNDAEGLQPPSRYAVALGKIYRPWNDPMDPAAHKSDVSEIKVPARFLGEAGHYQDDIALVFMSSPVVYVTFIRPVCIDLNDEFDRDQLQASSKGRVSGWGLTEKGKESSVLLTAELPYVDVRKCLDSLEYDFKPYVTNDKICAGSLDGTTVCKGDSGGGLVFPNVDRGTRRYFLRGVVSTSPRVKATEYECNAKTYTTFTHIQPHATFIKDDGLGAVSERDGPVRVGGCVLPDYPAHGNYTVQYKPEAVPGQIYDTVLLTVTCDPGYRIKETNSAFCSGDNKWSEPSPQCSRFCKLIPQPSVKYSCRVSSENRTRQCNEHEPSGTVVLPTCDRPNFYYPGELADMHCVGGDWDYVAICQPECGTPTPKGEQLIINGVSAKHGELPWHAWIYDKSYTPFMQVCGGSLVSTTLVISAAHCFWNDVEKLLSPSRYAVALGKIYRPWNDPNDPGAQKSDVSSIKIPVRFMGEPGHYQDDIALVVLSTPIVYVTFIRPVCIDFDIEFDKRQLQPANMGKVSGWDLTSEDGGASPKLLSKELLYVDVEQCIADLPFDFRSYITSDKICAGTMNGTALCKGDSGGGLAFPTVDGRGIQRFYLRGVMSTAPSNGHKCNANAYTSFTHIIRHDDFIKKHLYNS